MNVATFIDFVLDFTIVMFRCHEMLIDRFFSVMIFLFVNIIWLDIKLLRHEMFLLGNLILVC